MQADRIFMLEFFKQLNEKIVEKYGPTIQIKFYILGGTFFVMNSLRNNSPDIDILCPEGQSYKILTQIGIPLAKEFEISLDLLYKNTLDCTFLPKNYSRLARPYKRERSNHPNLKIWTLSPYHIILSKLARYSPKDVNDINLIMTSGKFKIRKKELLKQKNLYDYSAIKSKFENNFKEFLNKYEPIFKKSWLEELLDNS